MYGLPKTVEVDGREYAIRNDGDFRVVIDCFVALDDAELSANERTLSSIAIFYADVKAIEDIFVLFDTEDKMRQAIEAMFEFFNGGEEETGVKSHIKLVDWEQDEKLICAAVNSVAKTEVRMAEYMHWWTFLSFYMSIGDCTLSTIISIRDKIAHGKKLEKYEQQFRRDNPQHFRWKKKTVAQADADELFEQIWNKS